MSERSFNISRRGFDAPWLAPGGKIRLPLVEVYGDSAQLDNYVASHGLSRAKPITPEGKLEPFETLKPKPDAETPAAQTLRAIDDKIPQGEAHTAIYERAVDVIYLGAITDQPDSDGQQG